jgi:hypothetical protein
MNRPSPKCGALHWLSERVQKAGSTNTYPLFGMCCCDGKVKLPVPVPAPEALQRFFSASTPESQHFHGNIRQYNAALPTTSLGAQVDDNVNRSGGGPPVFKIHGELHHQIGSFLPPPMDSHLSVPNCTSSTPMEHSTTEWGCTVAWIPT